MQPKIVPMKSDPVFDYVMPEYDRGVIAYELILRLGGNSVYFRGIETVETHQNDVIRIANTRNPYAFPIRLARNYIANLADPKEDLGGKLPYIAYADFLHRLTADGLSYLRSNPGDVMEYCGRLEFDTGHIRHFLMDITSDYEELTACQ